jgi:hypothetical protein
MTHSPQQLVVVWHQHLHADTEGPTFISATAWSPSIVLSSTSEHLQLPSGHTNAMAESFFAALKTEWTDRMIFATRAEARQAMVTYIEVFYNRQRLHSGLDYKTPRKVHDTFTSQQKAA